MIRGVIADLIDVYLVVLFARILLTWFPIEPYSPMARVERVLARVTDPVLAPVRRVLHPVRLGTQAIDLSPMVVFIVLLIVERVLRSA